jgi:hypothetical protein
MLVDITSALPVNFVSDFNLMPLPSSGTLWDVRDLERWRIEFRLCYKERTLHGVNEAGVLTRFQVADDGVQQSTVEWEEWCAEVGDIGTLVMTVGTLLSVR